MINKTTIKRKKQFLKYALLAFAIALLANGVALAQSFTLSRGMVAGGGHIVSKSSGGSFSLGGSIGQPVVGAMNAGTSYSLGSGFWGAGSPSPSTTSYPVYLPVIIRNFP